MKICRLLAAVFLIIVAAPMFFNTPVEAGTMQKTGTSCLWVCNQAWEYIVAREQTLKGAQYSRVYWYLSAVVPDKRGKCFGYDCVIRTLPKIYDKCGKVCGPRGTYACYEEWVTHPLTGKKKLGKVFQQFP
jgi:hypothetical protein